MGRRVNFVSRMEVGSRSAFGHAGHRHALETQAAWFQNRAMMGSTVVCEGGWSEPVTLCLSRWPEWGEGTQQKLGVGGWVGQRVGSRNFFQVLNYLRRWRQERSLWDCGSSYQFPESSQIVRLKSYYFSLARAILDMGFSLVKCIFPWPGL